MNAESKLEQAALDNCVCKTGDCVHYKSFMRGVNWQSLTTPASNGHGIEFSSLDKSVWNTSIGEAIRKVKLSATFNSKESIEKIIKELEKLKL